MKKPIASSGQESPASGGESWVCPVCETESTGHHCVVCGYCPEPQPQEKKQSAFRLRNAVAAAVLILVIAVVGYTAATVFTGNHLIAQGRYPEAYICFVDMKLPFFRRTGITWAENAWLDYAEESKDFPALLKALDQLPQEEELQLFRQRTHYQYARRLELEKKYQDAYENYVSAGDYLDAAERKAQLLPDWVEYIHSNGSLMMVNDFANTVTLNDYEGRLVFKQIMQWDMAAKNQYDYRIREKLLLLIPNALRQKENLILLYGGLAEASDNFDWWDNYLSQNRDLLTELWDTVNIRDLISQDGVIQSWLMGRWDGANDLSLTFYTDTSTPDLIYCNFTLPAPKMPAETDHYFISDMTLGWADKNGTVLEEVFHFIFSAPDELTVFCYETGETVTLRRAAQ